MLEYRKCGRRSRPLETKSNESFVCVSSAICTTTYDSMEEAADAGLENGDRVLPGRRGDTLLADGPAGGDRAAAGPGLLRH